jgi:glutathione reductase (NADPH)
LFTESIKGIEHCISSDGFFELTSVPERALVFGGGYIALECAQILHQFGCKTIQIVRRQLLNPLDNDVRNCLLRNMKVSGFDIRFGINVVEVIKKENGKYDVILSNGTTEETDVVLMATGRRPKISQLGLENTGIKIAQDDSIEVDDFENTSVKGKYK